MIFVLCSYASLLWLLRELRVSVRAILTVASWLFPLILIATSKYMSSSKSSCVFGVIFLCSFQQADLCCVSLLLAEYSIPLDLLRLLFVGEFVIVEDDSCFFNPLALLLLRFISACSQAQLRTMRYHIGESGIFNYRPSGIFTTWLASS